MTQSAASAGSVLLSEVWTPAWSSKWFVLLGALIGAVTASAISMLLPTHYVAATEVLLISYSGDAANPIQGRRFNGVNVDSAAQVATSAGAVFGAARAAGVDTGQLAADVTVVPDTSVLVLYVTAKDNKVATVASRVLAAQLVKQRSQELGIPAAQAARILREGQAQIASPDQRIWLSNGAASGMLVGLAAGYTRLKLRPAPPL